MAKEANPIPQGKYIPATRFGNMIFTAGMTPRNNGVLIRTGKVKASDDMLIIRTLLYRPRRMHLQLRKISWKRARRSYRSCRLQFM